MKRILLSVCLPVLLIAFWHGAVKSGWWPEKLIAPPFAVAKDFVSLARTGELFAHARHSVGRLLAGFLIGTGLGVTVGGLVGVFKKAETILAPTVQALVPIPPPAWIPLLVIMLGIGEYTKIGLIAIGAFAIVFTHTVDGIRSADERLVEVATTYQKSRLYVLLPSAAPNLLTGLRVALGLSWILLVASEMISSKMVSPMNRLEGIGLGWMIFDARRFSRPDDMIVAMVTIGLLGKASDEILKRTGDHFLRWRQAFKGV